MSTILKALRRLEEEKAATEEPRPLREQIASAPRAARPRRSGWLAASGALVLGVATGGALIWWLFGNPTPAPVVAAAAPTVPAPAPQPAPVAVPELPVPAAPGPPEDAFASDVEIVDRPEALPMVADSDPVHPGSNEPKPGSVRPFESSAAADRARQAALAELNAAERARRGLPPERVAPSAPTPAEPVPVTATQLASAQPAPAPAPPAPAAPTTAPVAPAEPPAPAPLPVAQAAAPEAAARQPAAKPPTAKAPTKRAARKPAAVSAPAPAAPPAPQIAVSVERTQWHPLADRRIAWLRLPGDPDALRVVEGDVVDGLLITAIEPSGVVFERDGEKIRRPLGR